MMMEAAGRAPFFHPSTRLYRFTNLLFISSLSFGSYFAYDIIGAIAPSLIEELKASRATVGTMNTMYSIAAILVVLFGGMLIDRLGTRKASIVFSVLVFSGAVIVWLAKSIPLIFLGRFIFGAGSEPLVVAQSAMLARWFKNKEIAMAFGVQLTVSRIGSLFAFNTGELFSSYFGSFRYALLAAVGACALSLIGNLFYIIMDKRGKRSSASAMKAPATRSFSRISRPSGRPSGTSPSSVSPSTRPSSPSRASPRTFSRPSGEFPGPPKPRGDFWRRSSTISSIYSARPAASRASSFSPP